MTDFLLFPKNVWKIFVLISFSQKILKTIDKNSHLTPKELAVRLGQTEETVKKEIQAMEAELVESLSDTNKETSFMDFP